MYLYPYQRQDQRLKSDVKGIATERSFVSKMTFSPKAISDTAILASTALTSSAKVIKTGLSNPDITRNVTVKGNAAGIAGTVTVKGTNMSDETITEDLTLNGDTSVAGTKAFKTVSEVDLPAKTNTDDKVSVGYGKAIGIPFKLSNNTVIKTFYDGSAETTAPTVATSKDNIESNTIAIATTLAAKVLETYVLV